MKELLTKAAEILSEGGHIKFTTGDTSDPSTPHCAIGALVCAQEEGYSGFTQAVDALNAAVGPFGYHSVIDFNNADDTTGEDVILLFKQLAA
jgi:hypothetical protein